MHLPRTLMLLGAGELGKEFVIAAQRLGNRVIAVDRYADAPAMQVADVSAVINMLNADELERVINQYQPDLIIPEIEAIRTEKLLEFEARGIIVIPNARAVNYTMNRDRIRDLAAHQLGLRTARYAYATTLDELKTSAAHIGFPNVVKPVMSSSGKGQSVVHTTHDLVTAWNYALQGSRGDSQKVIIEEFIAFELEITLLTIRQWQGATLFCPPISHRQEQGDYRESWQPAQLTAEILTTAQTMAQTVTEALGGAGIFGVEFFITHDEVIFSELSPRPHDTGMVTLISQNLNEFELHLRAVLGLPIPQITLYGPSASAVILATDYGTQLTYTGIREALAEPDTDVRLFGKPEARPYRRLGVALARAQTTEQARTKAVHAANQVVVSCS